MSRNSSLHDASPKTSVSHCSSQFLCFYVIFSSQSVKNVIFGLSLLSLPCLGFQRTRSAEFVTPHKAVSSKPQKSLSDHVGVLAVPSKAVLETWFFQLNSKVAQSSLVKHLSSLLLSYLLGSKLRTRIAGLLLLSP